MTPAEKALPRLERLTETGSGRGIARCPAHDDKSPSLSWRICDDETLLLHCWAGCDAHSIVDAIGLTLRDLFPGSHIDRRRLNDQRIDHRQACCVLRLEAMIIVLGADQIARGIVMAPDDLIRMQVAARRIRDAIEATTMRR